ncbi:hypothetical protein GCM10023185_07100 [Hymenobacter saemangeumensis]|uniref:Exonuclease domain-containing protein n=1 Tax=Hymenobacter saemangeumensis TaxID=1084522 RepID=A0ABP8I2E9_9BACT
MLHNLVVFDFETTGFNPVTDRIDQLAALKFEGGQLVDAFCHLVRTGADVPQDCVDLNGITREMCDREGLNEELAFRLLRNFMGTATLVAHNASFDTSFLHQAYLRLGGKALTNNFICTKTLAVAHLPRLSSLGADARTGKPFGPHTLSNLCLHYGIVLEGAHRALNDVQATYKLLDMLRATWNEEEVVGFLNCCGRGPKHHPQRGLPPHAKNIIQ